MCPLSAHNGGGESGLGFWGLKINLAQTQRLERKDQLEGALSGEF